MTDNISINSIVNSVSAIQVVNTVTLNSPGPQGPAGTFNAGTIPTIYPITNTSGSIGFISSYTPASATYSSSTIYANNSGSLGGILSSNYALQSYANSASLNAYNQASAFSVTTANSASLTAYNNASAFAVTQSNSASLNSYNLGVTYANSASLNAYNLGVLYSNSASSNAYNSASTYANSASSNAYNLGVTYSNSASLNSYNNASAFSVTQSNSASLNAYNSASSYTAASAYNNTSASVGYALNSASLGGIQAADYALETSSNTFVGTQAILTGASANKGLIVQGYTSQSADLQQWQDSSSAVKAYVNNVGVISAAGFTTGGNSVFNYTTTFQNSAVIPLIAKNLGGIADIQQWQNSSGSSIAGVTASGQIYTGSSGPITNAGGQQSQFSAYVNTPSVTPLVIKAGPSASTSNVAEFWVYSQTSAPYVWINNSGGTTIRSTSALSNTNALGGYSMGTSLGVATGNQLNTAITIRATTSQNADNFLIQNVTPTVLAGFNGIGQLYTGSTNPVLTLLSTTASIIPSGTSNSASVYTTNSAHTLNAGQLVYIGGASPTYYNGPYYVSSIVSSSVFTITTNNLAFTASATTQGSVYLAPQTSVVSTASNVRGLIVKAAAGSIGNSSGTTPLMEWQDGAGTVLGRVEFPGGNLRWDFGFRVDSIRGSSDNLITMRTSGSTNLQLGGGTTSIGSGSGVIGITNATTVPSTNPVGGGILYVDSGSLKYRGPNGTVTTLAGP